MKNFEIYTGAEIPTLGGYYRVISKNACSAYCEEIEVDEDGNEACVGESVLTASDIAQTLRQYDGGIYKVVFLDEYSGEEVTINEHTDCWLDLGYPRFALRTLDGDTVFSATYEQAGIDTEAEGDWEQYEDYMMDIMGFIPNYEVG